jgi:hypothetical protein
VTEPGDGTIEVLRVRFTNLGPEPAPPFRYTLYRQALAAVPEERGGAVAGPDSVPTLAPQQHVDHRYRLPLARGTSNVFRIGYSPDLRDRNAANHQVEYRLSVP